VDTRLEASGAGTWEIRPESGEIVLSPRSRELLGVTKEGEDGAVSLRRFGAALDPGDRERWNDAIARLLHGVGSDQFRVDLRTAGAPERWLAVSGRAFFRGTRAVHLVGTFRDITNDAPDRLQRVVRDGAGDIVLRRERVALAEICYEAIDEARRAHPGRPIELDRPDEALGDWDRSLVLEVVRQVLGNALEQSAAGQPVFVSVLDCGDGALLSIVDCWDDSADGEPPREAWLTDRRVTHVLHEIVRAHDGWIDVSNVESATVFTIWLPKLDSQKS
jgi:signal transduction histidine kinase